jgi:hypothetical protein
MRVLGLRWLPVVGIGNLLATVIFAMAAIYLVAAQPTRGGLWAYVVVLAAVLPLLILRRHPVLAPWAVATATLLAQLTVGPLVTCGVVFPTTFVIIFQLGSRLIATTRIALGGLGVIATIMVELLLDPVLGTADAAVFVFGLSTTFFIGGLLIRSRIRMTEDLRHRTRALAEQRDRTAALAVAADRARISADLEVTIRSRVAAIVEAAGIARDRSVHELTYATTTAALTEIEEQGRQALAGMRSVVGGLRDAPTDPAPGLDDLAALLQRATAADVRLRVEGDIRSLGPNTELTAYRITEQLLTTLVDGPPARITVTVRFAPDTLEVAVVGPARAEDSVEDTSQVSAALAAAATRAEVAGGRLEAAVRSGQRHIQVVLPVLRRLATSPA